jgi:hypothetical protein
LPFWLYSFPAFWPILCFRVEKYASGGSYNAKKLQ